MAHSLAITSSGIPLIPGADRGFSPDPISHDEETSSLTTSERSSMSQQLGAASEQATKKPSLQKELDTLQKSHGKTIVSNPYIHWMHSKVLFGNGLQ